MFPDVITFVAVFSVVKYALVLYASKDRHIATTAPAISFFLIVLLPFVLSPLLISWEASSFIESEITMSFPLLTFFSYAHYDRAYMNILYRHTLQSFGHDRQAATIFKDAHIYPALIEGRYVCLISKYD